MQPSGDDLLLPSPLVPSKNFRHCLSDLYKHSLFPACKYALGGRKDANENPIRFGLFLFLALILPS